MPRLRRVVAALAVLAGLVGLPAHAGPGVVVWTPTLPADEGFDHYSAFASGVVYAQYGNGYARSTDFGGHWAFLPGPDDLTGDSGILRFATPTRGYAVVGRVSPALVDPSTGRRCPLGLPAFALDVTRDGGSHWAPACTPVTTPVFGGDFSPQTLAVARGSTVVVVAGDVAPVTCRTYADIRPVVFESRDAASSWTRSTLPRGYTTNPHGDTVRDARHVTVIAQHNTGSCAGSNDVVSMDVFATYDGHHYRRIFRCPKDDYCTSTAWVGRRIIVGLDTGQLFVSNDNGRHFFRGALLRDAHYGPLIASGQVDARVLWAQAMSFATAKDGFASTRGSGTWRTTDGGVTWTQERSPECVYSPFGVGDIAAADAEHGITGEVPTIDIRQPGSVETGCLTPQQGKPQLATGFAVRNYRASALLAHWGDAAARADGAVAFFPRS